MTEIDTSTPAAVARAVFEALSAHDLDALLPLAAEDVVEDWPIIGRFEGIAAVRDHFAAIFAAVPDFTIEAEKIVSDGDAVFAHWHMRGTFTGAPFYGLAATGRPIDLRGTDYFTVRNGKVASNFVAYDGVTFAVQVGILPAHGSPGDRVLTQLTNLRTRLQRALHR